MIISKKLKFLMTSLLLLSFSQLWASSNQNSMDGYNFNSASSIYIMPSYKSSDEECEEDEDDEDDCGANGGVTPPVVTPPVVTPPVVTPPVVTPPVVTPPTDGWILFPPTTIGGTPVPPPPPVIGGGI